ncbi:MAG TPA: sulfite exporter TauE/SafE family protein [Candidatus Baltobacteraceae bacterium]|nr:sulfite exporter TauE/SafE family protein [Candidatus Baltobacteraceae bacterium]
MSVHAILLILLGLFAIVYIAVWGVEMKRRGFALPKPLEIGIGFVTNFFDTLGIGSFAPTTTMFKFWKLSPDERIPGTLNVGHTLPTITEALIFIAIVSVAPLTLILLIVASIVGAWLGAGVVAKWPRRYVQIGMGLALIAAGILFIMKNLNILQGGGNALSLSGTLLWVGVAGNFILGALMTIGIGLYAPAMIMVALLGMSPIAAFPIMMGSCAFLMPIASWRFIKFDAYTLKAALGLTIGGVPGVLAAAYIVKSLNVTALRWLVAAVVIYTAIMMLRSAMVERTQQEPVPMGTGTATP